jgi:hypothetical protein
LELDGSLLVAVKIMNKEKVAKVPVSSLQAEVNTSD